MTPLLPTRHRGILTSAAAERRGRTDLAGHEVTYEVLEQFDLRVAINVRCGGAWLGSFISFGEDGIMPIEDDEDAN